jgi:hypothetical protein
MPHPFIQSSCPEEQRQPWLGGEAAVFLPTGEHLTQSGNAGRTALWLLVVGAFTGGLTLGTLLASHRRKTPK